MAEGVQGYLVVTVVEASGKSRDDTYVWDDATKEGYVKGKRGAGKRRGCHRRNSRGGANRKPKRHHHHHRPLANAPCLRARRCARARSRCNPLAVLWPRR
jgi:hypothetical protein